MSSSDDEHDVQELDLSDSNVVTKYKAAAEICNKALAAVVAEVKVGAKIVDLCNLGDSTIDAECGKCFKGKDIEKGIAFPTCASVNSVVGHFSPLADSTVTLAEGDIVKIDIGAHIDGFIGTQATTVCVGDGPVTGKAADVMAAANTAFEAALRLMRPGKQIGEVAETLGKVTEAYGCELVEGVMSHQMKQYIIDGNKCVLNKPTPESKVEEGEFEVNEVYAIDIVVSTGDGKTRVQDEKETTVYKRDLGCEYNLKLKASREVFSEVNKRFPTMPFTMRALDNKRARLGLVECVGHGLLLPYPVLHEKDGELVAQVKGTVLLMPNGSDRVTVPPPAGGREVKSEKSVEDEAVKAVLASSIKTKKKKNKKPKA